MARAGAQMGMADAFYLITTVGHKLPPDVDDIRAAQALAADYLADEAVILAEP